MAEIITLTPDQIRGLEDKADGSRKLLYSVLYGDNRELVEAAFTRYLRLVDSIESEFDTGKIFPLPETREHAMPTGDLEVAVEDNEAVRFPELDRYILQGGLGMSIASWWSDPDANAILKQSFPINDGLITDFHDKLGSKDASYSSIVRCADQVMVMGKPLAVLGGFELVRTFYPCAISTVQS